MNAAAELMAELHDVIDRVAALDTSAMEPSERRDLAVAVQRERNRLTVAASAPLSEWESRGEWWTDGSLNPSLALGRETKSCRHTSREELRRARRLQEMPHTRAAILDGRLSVDHADLFIRYATPARWPWFERNEEALVTLMTRHSLFDDCRRIMRYWADLVDDQLDAGREGPAPSTLYASRSKADGSLKLDGLLGTIDAEIVQTELRRREKEVRADNKAKGIRMTPAQVRAAALVRMAERSSNATGMQARPLFQLIVGDRKARQICELASGHIVTPHELLPYLDDAVMETFFFDGPKTVIAKSQMRLFKGVLRKAIQVRDRHCEHSSGCPTPSIDCDIDHRVPWTEGGETSQFNGGPKCPHQNRHKQFAGTPVPPAPERSVTRRDLRVVRLRWHIFNGADDPDDWLREQGSNLRPAD